MLALTFSGPSYIIHSWLYDKRYASGLRVLSYIICCDCVYVSGDRYLGTDATDRREILHDGTCVPDVY